MSNSGRKLRRQGIIGLDRALSGGVGRQLLIYFFAVIVSFLILLGIALLLRIPLISEKAEGFGDFWTMLFFFYDGGLEGTAPSNRWFVYLVNIIGSILMGGLLIATLTNYLQSSREKAEKGLLRYRLSDHIVFIGCHRSMIPLVESAIRNGNRAVVLSELTPEEMRGQYLSALSDKSDSSSIVLYYGSRSSGEELESLCLETAKEVFVFPDISSMDADSESLEVVETIAGICEEKGRNGLPCTVLFLRDAVVSCFERSNINARIREHLEFTPIVYGDSVARNLLSGEVFGNTFLDREVIGKDSPKYVHLFIIGLGDLGQALFVQAARQLHFPNYQHKSLITLVGNQGEIQDLKARYREFFAVADGSPEVDYLGDFLDLSVDFIPIDAVGELDSAMDGAIGKQQEIVTVAICFEDSAVALKRAISLPRSVFESIVPVWLYKPDSDSLARLIGEDAYYSNIIPFGNPEKLFAEDLALLAAQRINWVYSVFARDGAVPDALPDAREWESVWTPAWKALSVGKKWSNLHHADTFPVKMRSLGLAAGGWETITAAQLEILSRVEHNRWVTETLLAGFRPPTKEERTAMEKDISLKEKFKRRLVHLDLCCYDDLLPDAAGVDVRDYDKVIEACIPLILSHENN